MSNPDDIVQGHLIEEETFGSLVLLENRKGDLVRIVPVTEMDIDKAPDRFHDTIANLVT